MDLTDGDLAEMQDEADSRMTNVCRVTRSAPVAGEINPVTGLPAAGNRDLVYGPTVEPHGGKCRVRTAGTVSTGMQRQAGADVVTQVTPILSVPVSAPRLLVNDRVEILSSANPNLPALVFTVSGLIPGSQMTAQRVAMTAVID